MTNYLGEAMKEIEREREREREREMERKRDRDRRYENLRMKKNAYPRILSKPQKQKKSEKNEGTEFDLHVYCASWDRTSKYLDPSFDELRDVNGLKIHQSVWIRKSVSVTH